MRPIWELARRCQDKQKSQGSLTSRHCCCAMASAGVAARALNDRHEREASELVCRLCFLALLTYREEGLALLIGGRGGSGVCGLLNPLSLRAFKGMSHTMNGSACHK